MRARAPRRGRFILWPLAAVAAVGALSACAVEVELDLGGAPERPGQLPPPPAAEPSASSSSGASGHNGSSSGSSTPGPSEPEPEPLDLVDVYDESARELRGVWVSTIASIDFPGGGRHFDAAQARARFEAIADKARDAGLNALFFQVRPESDALYRSNLEPWSRVLTGTQGRDPGYDPLGLLLEIAHQRGLEVHAWVNPYRAVARAADAVTSGHITKQLAAAAVTYNGAIVMDPGAPEVRAWVLRVLDDLLAQYAVDGLHFDDYFYPYPDARNTAFPDSARYQAYRNAGGTLALREWRVGNVNAMVRESMDLVQSRYPRVRFGISPFGIHRPDSSLGISGMDAYAVIGCDAPHWAAEGWVDYLAPQLYWATNATGQAFGTLAKYWTDQLRGDVQLWAGHGLYRMGTSNWQFSEIERQVGLVRAQRERNPRSNGSIQFTLRDLEAGSVAAQFASRLYPAPALVPALPRAVALDAVIPPPRSIERDGEQAWVHAPQDDDAVFVALYRERGDGWTLHALAPATEPRFAALPSGRYAASRVRRGGGESRALRFEWSEALAP